MAISARMQTDKCVFFWKAGGEFGEFSQWFYSPFVYNGKTFRTAEQFMMYMKAVIFNDKAVANKILNTPRAHPAEHRKMGRSVRGFSNEKWNKESMAIVVMANILKFTQNEDLMRTLLSTTGAILVEASPMDPIWGIGFGAETAADNSAFWGENRLGQALMWTRMAIIASAV